MSFGFAIGDFIAVGQLAWTLYRDCYMVARGAPQEFQLLLKEIHTLSGSINILQEEIEDPDSTLVQAGEDRVRMVNEMVSRISVTLKELQKVANKYKLLGSGLKRKQIWAKILWSVEFRSIDSLRSKLVYHNTVMNLLLTSAGNSSLKRIESSTKALEADVVEIKGYIRASSKNLDNQPFTAPQVSVVGDELFKVSLSAALMMQAEILQPWSSIGVDQWIQAGRWWLLKAEMELYATPALNQAVTLSAYTNLIKASWILIDVIACHPQLSFLNSNMHYEVQLLSAELKREFQRINTLNLLVPDLHKLEDQNLQIWETQAKGPLLQPSKKLLNADPTQTDGGYWTVGGEHMYFQRFALYRRHGLTESLPCMVLFLVHEETHVARIVAQDQNGTALMEVALEPEMDARIEEGSVIIGAEHITFTTDKDAELLCTIFEAAKFYFFCRGRDSVNQNDFKGFILLVAVKNKRHHAIMRLLDNYNSKTSFPEKNCLENVLAVASTLASQVISHQLIDEMDTNPGREWSQISLFSWAVQCGHVAVVQLLLEEGADVSEKNSTGWTMLHQAAKNGHEAVVQLLVENGADVNAKDNDRGTALHDAAGKGDKRVVQLLLENGADVDAKNSYKRTALHEAAREGHKEVVQLLLEKAVDVNTKDACRETALHKATSKGHKEVVQLLLENKADVNAKNDFRGTALHEAVSEGHKAVVQLLLENGADVNIIHKSTGTALHKAARQGNKEAVQLLLENGADVNAKDNDGGTALRYAASKGHERVVQLLLQNGADVNAKNNYRGTALHEAAREGHKAVLQLLLENQVDVNAKDAYRETALHKATSKGHKEVVRLLLENGADISAKNNYRATALHAASKVHESVVQLLLENGADVNAKDNDGETALHDAAGKGHERVVQLLLQNGADVNAKDNEGRTAMYEADVYGHQEVVQVLKSKT